MNGKILDFSPERGVGALRGDDGNRYGFGVTEFRSQGKPVAGMVVDFDIEDGAAVGIFAQKGRAGSFVEKTKNAFSNIGQQIMHGDPNATITLPPEQAQEAAEAKLLLPAPEEPPETESTDSRAALEKPVDKVKKVKPVERPEPIFKCPDCGKKVSSRADECPHCGGPVARCVVCKTPLDLSVDQCSACGHKGSTSPVGSTAVSCPKCYGDSFRKKAGGCLFILLLLFLWPWLITAWAFSHLIGKPDFMKPEYSCSRCDNVFRVNK